MCLLCRIIGRDRVRLKRKAYLVMIINSHNSNLLALQIVGLVLSYLLIIEEKIFLVEVFLRK